MTVNWQQELVDQVDFGWQIFRKRLEGLTDAEYLWEPAPGCWSIHPRADGTFAIDREWPDPRPAPLTTIAWRMGHIGEFLAMRSQHQFGAPYRRDDAVPSTARDAIDWIQARYDAWIGGVRSLTEDDINRPCGPSEGRFANYPLATLILHINRETIHHTAEIALLRDLSLRLGPAEQHGSPAGGAASR